MIKASILKNLLASATDRTYLQINDANGERQINSIGYTKINDNKTLVICLRGTKK